MVHVAEISAVGDMQSYLLICKEAMKNPVITKLDLEFDLLEPSLGTKIE